MLSNILNIHCKNIFNNFLIAESCRTRTHFFQKLLSPAPAPESQNASVLHRWFYGYEGSMMGFWFWFAGSFVWLEWMIVHGKSYFYICEKRFFLERTFVKSWCSILLLVGVNHSRIVASLLASISLYFRQGKPTKHLKVKSQAVIINY